MTEALYVATDRGGIDRGASKAISWALPSLENGTWHPGDGVTGADTKLILRSPSALLDALDETIFVAEALEATTSTGTDGEFSTAKARLLSKTPWDDEAAVGFALDCAEHITSGVTEVTLPDGTALSSVIGEARRVLQALDSDTAHSLGLIARLSAARRLRRKGEAIGDVARELLSEDVQANIDALDDPAYNGVAAVVDAVLGAVEAIRALALPRYVKAREEPIDEHPSGEPSALPSFIATPWGPIAIGAEHRSAYAPAWAAARDASTRARDAASSKADGGAAERTWQAARLAAALATP